LAHCGTAGVRRRGGRSGDANGDEGGRAEHGPTGAKNGHFGIPFGKPLHMFAARSGWAQQIPG
jgi:hypothetical protein